MTIAQIIAAINQRTRGNCQFSRASVNPKTIQVPAIIADIARIGDRLLQTVGLYNQELHVLSEMNLTIACAIDRAKRELGYKPLLELREGMRRSIKWCLDHGIDI